ncbi:HAMP domain-containing protein [Ancylomarina sp. YFZ004]
MEQAKHKIGSRLSQKFTLLILFIILIGIAGLISIRVLNTTSEKIVFEYIELDAVHDLRDSFNKTITPAYTYMLYHKESDLKDFHTKLDSARKTLTNCNKLLSSSHNKALFSGFDNYLDRFEHIISKSHIIGVNTSTHQELVEQINLMLVQVDKEIESLLKETKNEIDEYIEINSTAAVHCTITILSLLILITVIGYVSVAKFIKRITLPLKELVQSTKRISKGDLSVKTYMKTNDELEILGESFNLMVDELNKTTISKNYFNDILKSMSESIIVTDTNGLVSLSNTATRNLLHYTKSELNGKHINQVLMGKENKLIDFNSSTLCEQDCDCNKERVYISSSNERIPVLFSCSTLKNKAGDLVGVVYVARDIREQKEMNYQLDRIRKKHLIDINEAQEKERLRIARDIHDGLGVILTGISYYLDNNFPPDLKNNCELNQHINTIQDKIDEAINESKSIAHDLVPILLKDFGLAVAIENLTDELNKQYPGLFKFTKFNINARLDEKIENVLYRIVQETTNNILKHAHATETNIQLIKNEGFVSLIIVDNGVGFDYEAKIKETTNRGIGLISMRERIAAFDGLFSLSSEIGNGTEVLIEIPLN